MSAEYTNNCWITSKWKQVWLRYLAVIC